MYLDIYLDVIMNIDTAIVTIVTCITFCTELKPIESPLLQIDSSMTVSIILGTEPTQRMDSYHRTNQLVTARHFLTPQSMESSMDIDTFGKPVLKLFHF